MLTYTIMEFNNETKKWKAIGYSDARNSSDAKRYFVTENGKEGNKKVVSKIDQTIVNIIKETKVQGYEEWHKAVFETPNGTYRVYIGLKYGVGDANRLAEYIVANADEAVDIDELAKEATDSLVAIPTEEVTIVE